MLNFSQPALNFDVTVDILRSSIIALQFHSLHLGDPEWKSLQIYLDYRYTKVVSKMSSNVLG